MENKIFERIGNWYNVKLNDVIYEVLIQKEDDHTILCDPSSIIVFDNNFDKVTNPEVLDKIEEMMNTVDWKYDTMDWDF